MPSERTHMKYAVTFAVIIQFVLHLCTVLITFIEVLPDRKIHPPKHLLK